MKRIGSFLRVILLSTLIIRSYASILAVAESNEANIILTAITRHDPAMYNAFEDAFKKAHPEVDVDIEWLEITTNLGWIKAIKSTSYTVDFCWGGGPTVFTIIADKGLLKPLEDPNLVQRIENEIPSTISDHPMYQKDENGDYLWVASALSSFGYTVNHESREMYGLPMPKTWQDLGDPIWFLGQKQFGLAMGNAPGSIHSARIYQIISQVFGWDMGWQVMTMIGGNARIIGESGSARDMIITGPPAASMTIDFYGYQAMEANPNCEYIIPEGKSIIDGDPIAIARSCDELETTEMFIDFVLSKEAQAIWLDKAFNRLPIREDAFSFAESQGNKRDDLYSAYQNTSSINGISFNDSEAIANIDTFTFYFEATITNVHDELVETWAEVVDLYLNGDGTLSTAEFRSVIRTMTQPSITAQDCIQIQEDYFDNPTLIESYKNQWSADARTRFTVARNKAAAESSDSDDVGEYFSPYFADIMNLTEDQVLTTDFTVNVLVNDFANYNPLYGTDDIEFYQDGTLDFVDNRTPYNYELKVSTMADGPHSLMTMATENSGSLFLDWVNFQVGTTKNLPNYQITLPTGTVTGMSSINGSVGNSTEFLGIFLQFYLLSDNYKGFSLQRGITWSSKITSSLENFSHPLNSTDLPNGKHQLLVIIVYSSGNSIIFNAGSITTYNTEEEIEWTRGSLGISITKGLQPSLNIISGLIILTVILGVTAVLVYTKQMKA